MQPLETEPEQEVSPFVAKFNHEIGRRYQHLLDTASPHVKGRWTFTAVFFLIYCVRVYFLEGLLRFYFFFEFYT
jgi:hypothetical protein